MDYPGHEGIESFSRTRCCVREFPTSTGPVDYALFVDESPVGVAEAKKEEKGEDITTVETQSARYANSTFKWMTGDYTIRFAYECTDLV